MACHLAHSGQWVLPKGEGAQSELDEALKAWQGRFRLVSEPDACTAAAIVIADHVERRKAMIA
jgi:hypothetical protein